ncbi:MAG: RNA polymerase sigma factor [Vicinamibacteria bacterium]
MKRVIPLNSWKEIEGGAPPSPGDERFQELLSRYGAFLRKTVARMLPGADGISFEDVEQEARVELWRALQHEREISHPGSYVYKVAVTAALRAIRRAKARRETYLAEDGFDGLPNTAQLPDPEALASRQEMLRKLDSALTRLAESRRLAVSLHLRGMTTAEIGEILDWSEPKARNLVHRGLKDLRRELLAEGIANRA